MTGSERPPAAPSQGAILFAMTHSLPGGLRELWNDLAEGLEARGHSIARFVLYPHDDTPDLAADAAAWVRLARRRPRSPLGAVALFVALVRFLRRTRPVAVVTAMPAANVLVPLAVAVARVPTRVLITHHSPADTHHALLDRIDGLTGSLRCVAAVVSVSDAVAASLAHKPAAYRAKRVTLPNALPERIERQIDGLRVGAAGRQGRGPGVRVVALGRLTRQKNYPMLLRAIAHVPAATLEIVGAGPDEQALRDLATTLGAADRIAFAGLLSRDVALARAARADIFVQVSLYEGHSLALIEAARLALPLIVSDVAVQVEAITAADGTRCGIVVPLGDHVALAEWIAALAGDSSARARWSALALRLARESSHRAMIDRYEIVLAPPARSR